MPICDECDGRVSETCAVKAGLIARPRSDSCSLPMRVVKVWGHFEKYGWFTFDAFEFRFWIHAASLELRSFDTE